MKSRKILHGTCIGLLVFMLFGCAGDPSTKEATTGMELDVAIKEAATQMETKIPAGTMVALVSVASPSTAFSTQVLTRLESAIVSSGKLVVVDRANLDKVRTEQGFQLSGEVDDESAKSIGKILGAGAIVTGSLDNLGDVYSLTLKAINIETATVAVSYLADLTKSARIETLLGSGGGTAGTTITASGAKVSGGRNAAKQPAPVVPAIPSGVRAVDGSTEGTVTLSWSAAIKASGYYVYRAESAGGEFIHVETQTGTSFADTGLTPGKTYYYKVSAYNDIGESGQSAPTSVMTSKTYKIGDTGPAGGIIFYDKLSSTGGWRYLEAAPKAAEQKLPYGDIHPGPGETGLGTGKKNTQTLVEMGRGSLIAAQFCNDLEYGGYDDWFLPSRDELELMYTNLKAKKLGEFSDTRYWSSTYHNGNYWGPIWVDFSNGNRDTAYFTGKTTPELFRAIRQF